MAAIINTNIQSLNAQRNLSSSQNSLATSMQRLSSGLRINSAKDDAAGLAIAERMTTQIRGLNQAARNANDGVSLAQTAEGALGTIGNNLQRIRELAVQSRNATNSTEDRAALQKEVAQLRDEIGRVAKDTSFNGTKLLDGTFTSKAFQVGADQGQTIDIASIVSAKTSDLGTWTSVATSSSVTGSAPVAAAGGTTPATAGNATFSATSLLADFTTETASFDISVDGGTAVPVTLNADYSGAGGGTALAGAITTALSTAGTAAYDSVSGNITITSASTGATSTIALSNFNADADGNSTDAAATALPTVTATPGTASTTTSAGFAALTGAQFTINGENIEVGTASSATQRASDLVTAINAKSADTNVTATLVDGKVELRSASGDITIGGSSSDLTNATGFTLGNTSATGGLTGSTPYAAPAAQTGFAGVDVSTTSGADNAILAMDAALNAINSARADLGAIQNRFDAVVSNLTVSSENLTASRSRIMDADFAAETANLSRSQILQQAGTAMVAQANQLPQQVLKLLQG